MSLPKFLRLPVVFLSLCAVGTPALGQNLGFTHLTIDEGLSQNTIYCLQQDRTGYVWIGTEDGLNRYDGYEFKVYRHDPANRASIVSNQVNGVFEAGNGDLWVATSTGLDVFNRQTETFRHVNVRLPESTSPFITGVSGDPAGSIWIGTYDGIRVFDPKTGNVKAFTGTDDGSPGHSRRTYGFYIGKTGTVWAGVGSGLICIDSRTRRMLPLPAQFAASPEWGKSTVRAVKGDSRGRIWICTEKSGVFLFDPRSARLLNFTTSNSGIISNTVRDVFVRNDDEIWLGTRDGLSIYHADDDRFVNYTYNKYDRASLDHNSVRCFMRDRAGSIWLGTFSGGVNIAENAGTKFHLVKEQLGDKSGIDHRVVSSLAQTSANDIWIGTEGGGLNHLDRRDGAFRYYFNGSQSQKNPWNIIKALARDQRNNLWVGTFDGLFYFDTRTRSFKNYPLPGNKALTNNTLVCALFPEKDGVWVGTNGGGFTKIGYDGSLRNFIRNKSIAGSISSNNITAIVPCDGQRFWVGTENGLNLFDKRTGKFRSWFEDISRRGLSSSSILSLLTDSKKRFWVGTKGGGLNLFRPSGKTVVIDTHLGLANDVIHAVAEDAHGDIWVSTNSGISKITINGLVPDAGNVTVRNFNINDGLQSNQFSPAVLQTGAGELFFGGINGITYFRPGEIGGNRYRPRVVITDFLIKNNSVSFRDKDAPLTAPIDQVKEITLTYDQAYITFKFAALNFINPSRNRYAYRLSGLERDEDWHYVGSQRNATYTNLQAGKYLFSVKAANNDGVWNATSAEIRLKVLPPPWKTWWAYLIYTFSICFLLYLFYYYSLKTARLKSELDLEQLTHEKDQELNQRKMAFFTNISHEIKTPLTLILAPLEKLVNMNEGNNKLQNQLMLMQRNGDRLLKLINQLLDFRKLDQGAMSLAAAEGNMVRFVKEVVFAFKSYAEHRNIDIAVTAETSSVRVWFDRDKFEKILYNLVSNSLKFTRPGGKITLFVGTETGSRTDQCVVKITDTGIGIKPAFIDRIFEQFNEHPDKGENLTGTGIGLSFTRGLVELHHGAISVESRPEEKGSPGETTFTVRIPLGNAHLNQSEMISNYSSSEDIESYLLSEVNPAKRSRTDSIEKILTTASGERPIMLVVEDNAEVLEFIAGHFRTMFDVRTAANGTEGWEIASSVVPDIIVSDVMMPGMSGTELCKKIKSDSRTSHIAVVLLTARTSLLFKIEGLETGADDYITKPFNLSLLETRVWNLLESRRKLRERFSREITLQPTNIAITSPDEKFLEKVLAFIEANIAEPTLNVEELGKEVCMSRVTLYRKIKALTNQTAIEFIRTVRIKRAAQLLAQQKFTVSEVSYMVGFTDVDYFRKCFKEQLDVTPREYAQRGSGGVEVK